MSTLIACFIAAKIVVHYDDALCRDIERATLLKANQD